MTLASNGLQNAVAYRWTYTDATARTSATGFVSTDVGALALQQSDNTLWMLTATTPTWVQALGVSTLTVDEVDGAPSVANVTHLTVSNGTLTDNGGGHVTVTTGGGGGTTPDKLAATGSQAYTSVQYPPANLIGWNSELVKAGITHSTTTNNSQITIATTSTYLLTVNTDFGAVGAINEAELELLVGGTQVAEIFRAAIGGPAGVTKKISVTTARSFTAGDVITLRWYVDGQSGTLTATIILVDLAAI